MQRTCCDSVAESCVALRQPHHSPPSIFKVLIKGNLVCLINYLRVLLGQVPGQRRFISLSCWFSVLTFVLCLFHCGYFGLCGLVPQVIEAAVGDCELDGWFAQVLARGCLLPIAISD